MGDICQLCVVNAPTPPLHPYHRPEWIFRPAWIVFDVDAANIILAFQHAATGFRGISERTGTTAASWHSTFMERVAATHAGYWQLSESGGIRKRKVAVSSVVI